MRQQRIMSLEEVAIRAMLDKGFLTDYPPAAIKEIMALKGPAKDRGLKDMRKLLWVSIDNDDSLDLDQITYAEGNRFYVAIADVDGIVKKNSAIDRYAAHNTTSVYTPMRIFAMLPPQLSTDLTSLNPDEDRTSIVVEMEMHGEEFQLVDVYRAYVKNHAKLTYNHVAEHLAGRFIMDAHISEQLKIQDKISQAINRFRNKGGALGFATTEMVPIMENGLPIGLKILKKNRAQMLIENFMIAANVCISRFFTNHNLPNIRRVVRTPKRWDRIMELARNLGTTLPDEPDVIALRDFLRKQQKEHPEDFHDLSTAVIKLIGRGEYVLGVPGTPEIGHFNLALIEYAHTTAPNRRFPDMIMQRLLKSALDKKTLPYSLDELAQLAAHCTEMTIRSEKVERRVLKSAAAMVMMHRIGEIFHGMITGSNDKGVFVKLVEIPIEGRVMHGFKGLDVGDRVMVKLTGVNPNEGHIDFTYVGKD